MSFARALAAVAAIFLLSGAAAPKRTNVVEAYAEIRAQIKGFDYTLAQRGGKWTAREPTEPTMDRSAEVDVANGFIRIDDEGTGGGNFETQIALWRIEGEEPLVGIVETHKDAGIPGQSRVRFFKKVGRSWVDKTPDVWTAVGLHAFMKSDMTIEDLRALETIGAAVYVALPRKGTTITAELKLGSIEEYACKNDPFANLAEKKPAWDRYCQKLKPALASIVALPLDTERTRFNLHEPR
jgi:hypothetical protein